MVAGVLVVGGGKQTLVVGPAHKRNYWHNLVVNQHII